MANVKNLITLGIGCNPGGLLWFITSGLGSAEAIILVPSERRTLNIGADDRTITVTADSRTLVA